MGGGASTAAEAKSERYWKDKKSERTTASTAESPSNSKAARESRRLQKMAMGQVDREYEKPVDFNKIDQINFDAKLDQRSNEPIPRSIANPSGHTGPAVADWAGRPLYGPRPIRNGPRPPPPRRPSTGHGPVSPSMQVIMAPSKLALPSAPSNAPPPGYEYDISGMVTYHYDQSGDIHEQSSGGGKRGDGDDDDDDDDYGGDESVYDWTAAESTVKSAPIVSPSPARSKDLQNMTTNDFQDEDDWPLADFSRHESLPTRKHTLVPLLNIPTPVARAVTPPRVYQRPPGVKIMGTPPVNKGSSREMVNASAPNSERAGLGQTMLASPMQMQQGRKLLAAAPPTAPRPMPSRPTTAQPPPMSDFPHNVKETIDVKRNRAQLPSTLVHAAPTNGDWLKKRYIVNNYILLDTLGTGSYGEVRLCKDRTNDKLYAIKIMNKDMLAKKKGGASEESYFEDIKREIAIMKKLRHPNVLQLFEVLDDPKVNKMYLVVEYVKNGDLTNILKSRAQSCAPGELPTLTDGEIWNIFRQLAAGVRYLHYQNVVHGDIKPQNLLIGEDGVVKIADFGISKMVHASSQKLADAAGTPAFMSPELCSGGSFSGQLADVWAMGITIFMLKFGQPPFIAGNIILLYHKIQSDPLVFPSAINPSLQELLVGMLQKDPEERCQLNEVIQHSWLRQPPVIRVQNQAPAQNFKPPDSYDRDERAAMEGPVHTINNEDIYSSIAFGTRSKQKVKADQLMASTKNEDIMATNWGDDVFEQVSDDGFDSDSEDDEDASSSFRKSTEFSTATTNSNSKEMPDFEINERENRFRNSSMHKMKAVEPTIDSSVADADTDARHKPGEVEDANDATEVSMDDFEKMMDTLALQPLRSRDKLTIDKKSLSGLQEDEDDFDDIRVNIEDGKFEVISQYHNKRNGVAAAFHSEQGPRKGQEDRCLLATSAAKIKAVESSGAPLEVFEVLSNFTIAGIFDGHNGAKCAQYVCQNLPPQLALHKKFLGKPNELEVALKESFWAVDEAVCVSLIEKGDNSGSTGLIAVYDGRKHILTVANVGDSVCILSRAGRAVLIHRTHRLDSEEERARVVAKGGTVVNSRVNGVLAISRAFGDIPFKYAGQSSAYGTGPVSCVPDIASEVITPMTEFAIIASDGLFDVVSHQEAVNFVRKRLAKKVDLSIISKELTDEAIKEGSIDNITVLLLSFHASFK